MNQNNLTNSILKSWSDNKFVGTAILPAPINIESILLEALLRIYNKNPTNSVIIIVRDFAERDKVISYLTNANNSILTNCLNNKYIKIFTENYIINNEKSLMFCYAKICFWYCPNEISVQIRTYIEKFKYRFIILSHRLSNAYMQNLYSTNPIIKGVDESKLNDLRTSSPVEETLIEVSIDENTVEFSNLKRCNDFISKSMNIFGDFVTLNYARLGNPKTNQTYNDICYEIAYSNGWKPNMEMTDLNIELDNLFNPNSIHERASETYRIITERSKLLSDYFGKLDNILNIVKDNIDKKILIINKSKEFAAQVTNYINSSIGKNICANFHDNVEACPAIDSLGNPIRYKNGPKAGEVKYIKASAQKTQNQILFNLGSINVLSTNNLPDKDLQVSVDVIIITSTQCKQVEEYIYRLSDVMFNSSCLFVYTLYIKNSLEEIKARDRNESKTHKLVNKCEDNAVPENNFNFIIEE